MLTPEAEKFRQRQSAAQECEDHLAREEKMCLKRNWMLNRKGPPNLQFQHAESSCFMGTLHTIAHAQRIIFFFFCHIFSRIS